MDVANAPGEVRGSGGKAIVFVSERTAGPDRDILKI
jgi:hypothetical protein